MSNSIYRLGTANMYDNALRNLGPRQTNLSNLQENLTSGKRVVRASDDPVSAAQAERAINRLARIQTEQRALETQRNAIAQAESALGDAVDLVQNFRELVVNAGSAALTPNDRNTIANQLQGLREQLLEVANRKDTNGVPLLSALGSALAPFLGPLSTSPDYSFEGLPGQTASSGVSIPNTLDGEAAFMFDPQRDGVYTAGVSAIPSSRFLNTTAVTPVDPSLVTGDNYTITLSAAGPGATPGTTTQTHLPPRGLVPPGRGGTRLSHRQASDHRHHQHPGPELRHQGHPCHRGHHYPAAQPEHVQHPGQRDPRHPQRPRQQCSGAGSGAGPGQHGHWPGTPAQHARLRRRAAQPSGPHHR